MTISEILEKIIENHTEEDVKETIYESIYDFVDEDWQDDGEYESEHDWYFEFCTDEAQSQTLQNIIHGVTTDISMNDYCKIYDTLWDLWDL